MDRRNGTLIIIDLRMHADIKCAKALKRTQMENFFFASSLSLHFMTR